MTNIKAILFDYGGVLGSDSDDFENTFKQITVETGLSNIDLHTIFDKHWETMVIGQTRPDAFWEEVAQRANYKDQEKLSEIYNQSITIDKGVLKIAQKYQGTYILGILSNAAYNWMETKKSRFNLEDTFSKIYSSAHLKMKKPNKEIYEYVIKDLVLAPQQIVFIDNLERNTIGAEKCGFKTIIYQNPEQLERELANMLRSNQL